MKRLPVVFLIVIALLVLASLALALPDEFQLSRHRIAGGGGVSGDEGRYFLSGTIGQPEAGQSTDGARFALRSGYWSGPSSASAMNELYLPVVLSSS